MVVFTVGHAVPITVGLAQRVRPLEVGRHERLAERVERERATLACPVAWRDARAAQGLLGQCTANHYHRGNSSHIHGKFLVLVNDR